MHRIPARNLIILMKRGVAVDLDEDQRIPREKESHFPPSSTIIRSIGAKSKGSKRIMGARKRKRREDQAEQTNCLIV